MVSRSAERLAAAAAEVPGATCEAADVVDRAAVLALVARVVGAHGKIDLLVNCAGVMYFTLMKNGHHDEWEQTIDINCKGTVNCAGAVLPHMLAAKAGHVVNISSDAARTVFPALTVYNAAKAFVQVFSKGLRAECVGTGVRVTDIQPGDTATNLIMANSDREAADKTGVGIGKVVGDGVVGPMCLDPADVADAVLYAVTAAPHIGVHEVLIEPRDQMFGDPTAMGDAA
jgi:NADP-dependent 3-hydroxy acid dehydrogenase YdfG